jgi:hypothetical protein
MAADPVAGPGQVPPSYLFALSFGFANSTAQGAVGLVDGPSGKFAVLNVVDPGGVSHSAAVPFAWSGGHYYYLFVYQTAPGIWGAWVYDYTVSSWLAVGQVTLPVAWGKLAPTSATSAPWYGPTATSCAAYPGADVLFYPPVGYVGTTPFSATLSQTALGSGDCAATTSLFQGIWARYQTGTG